MVTAPGIVLVVPWSAPASGVATAPGTSKVNRKYKGPDALGLDIRVRGWDEQIKARMQLYQLTPTG